MSESSANQEHPRDAFVNRVLHGLYSQATLTVTTIKSVQPRTIQSSGGSPTGYFTLMPVVLLRYELREAYPETCSVVPKLVVYEELLDCPEDKCDLTGTAWDLIDASQKRGRPLEIVPNDTAGVLLRHRRPATQQAWSPLNHSIDYDQPVNEAKYPQEARLRILELRADLEAIRRQMAQMIAHYEVRYVGAKQDCVPRHPAGDIRNRYTDLLLAEPVTHPSMDPRFAQFRLAERRTLDRLASLGWREEEDGLPAHVHMPRPGESSETAAETGGDELPHRSE